MTLKVSTATGTGCSMSSQARRFYCENICKTCVWYFPCSFTL